MCRRQASTSGQASAEAQGSELIQIPRLSPGPMTQESVVSGPAHLRSQGGEREQSGAHGQEIMGSLRQRREEEEHSHRRLEPTPIPRGRTPDLASHPEWTRKAWPLLGCWNSKGQVVSPLAGQGG